MHSRKSRFGLPIPVQRALRKLGQDIRDARKRRRLPMSILAERAAISRITLMKVEKGDPSVSVGIIASVLFALGMLKRFEEIADAVNDSVGRMLEEEHLPQRIRRSTPNPLGENENE